MTGGFIRYAPTAGPSRWLLVAGRRFVAAVESTVTDEIVDQLLWLADSDLATIESVVGAFPLAGPGQRPVVRRRRALRAECGGRGHGDGRRARLRGDRRLLGRRRAPILGRAASSRGCSPSSVP